jgi:cell wall-associated NlpC family hydrolase
MSERSKVRRRLAGVALVGALALPVVVGTAGFASAAPIATAGANPVSDAANTAKAALASLLGSSGTIPAGTFESQVVAYEQGLGMVNPDPWTAISASPYVAHLANLSVYVGTNSGVNAPQLLSLWIKTDNRRMVAVLAALAQLGTPYRSRGQAPGGFDCSGLYGYAWEQAGVAVPRSSGSIISGLRRISQAELQPGDVVWRSGHVQMYLGLGDATVHSPQHGRRVEVTNWGRVSRFGSPI